MSAFKVPELDHDLPAGKPIPLAGYDVRYNGLFDFDGLYAAIVDWTKNYGYQWHEKTYKHKVPRPKGAEQQFTWILDKKVNDLVSYKVTLNTHVWDLMEVEVDIDGKKKLLSNARIEISVKGQVTFDWQKKFAKGGPWAKLWWSIYSKVMQRDFEVGYLDTLHYRLFNFQNMLKKYFDMQTKYHSYKGYLGES